MDNFGIEKEKRAEKEMTKKSVVLGKRGERFQPKTMSGEMLQTTIEPTSLSATVGSQTKAAKKISPDALKEVWGAVSHTVDRNLQALPMALNDNAPFPDHKGKIPSCSSEGMGVFTLTRTACRDAGNKALGKPKSAKRVPSGYGNEDQFQRAWMNLHFDRSGLRTVEGFPVRIMNPGRLNRNQGPDFLDAEIMIGGARHCGHVELHLRQSDWINHGHHSDPQYLPVVLHVFLVPGKQPSLRVDGVPVPGLCLEGRIRPPVGSLPHSRLPCGDFGKMNLPDDAGSWLEAEGMKRIKLKAEVLKDRLKALHFDWSQLLWEELAAILGGPVNGEHLRTLTQKAPWTVMRKYVHSRICMEALLFGQAGLLEGNPLDTYQRELQDNWIYLKAKHGLRQASIPFKFHRMRPAGFPTLRIAHLAMLAEHYRPLCQLLERDTAIGFCKSEFDVRDYWAVHHDFGNTLNQRRTDFGQDVRHRVAVNVLAPLGLLGWKEEHVRWDSTDQSSEEWRTEAVNEWLTDLPPEDNAITRKFEGLGLQPENSLQAQGMLGIYKSDCSRLGCLQCAVGRRFLGRGE